MADGSGKTLVDEILSPYEAVRGHGNPNDALRDIWAQHWGTNYGTAEFWFAYAHYAGKLAELTNQIREYARDDRSRGLFLSAVLRLQAHYDAAYIQNSVANIHGLDETFNIVHLSSAILPSTMNEGIEVATAGSISEQLNELIDDLNSSEIAGELRRFLQGNFTFLRWATINYGSIGLDGLSKAYGMVASEFIRAWGKKEGNAGATDPWWEKAKAKMKLIGEGVIWTEKFASGAEKLIGHVDDISGMII